MKRPRKVLPTPPGEPAPLTPWQRMAIDNLPKETDMAAFEWRWGMSADDVRRMAGEGRE